MEEADEETSLDTYHPSFSENRNQPKSSSVLGRVFRLKSKKTGPTDSIRQNTLQIPALSLTSVGNEPQNSANLAQLRPKPRPFQTMRQNNTNYLADYVNPAAKDQLKLKQDDDDEEDEDDGFGGGWFFGAAYAKHRTSGNRLQEPPMSSYEDWLDDRQGMNSGEQHELRTKGEQQAQVTPRPSIDGSIISNLSGVQARQNAPKSASKTLKMRSRSARMRGRSPLGRQTTNRRREAKGLLSLASRLRLTKKHESIAKFQLTVLQSGLISLKKLDRDLQTFLPSGRMSSKELGKHVELIRKYPILAQIEYKFASRYETYVCRHAQQEENAPKNNYKRCIPYDYNRVVLRTLPQQTHSDYINASFVDSCLKPNAYIAAQGPNEHTLDDFWRMVWEQRSFVLVMLTKVFDFIKVMCNQYWPIELNKSERHGNIEVTLLYEEPLADFVIRTIRLTYHKTSSSVAPNTSIDANDNNTGQDTNQEELLSEHEQESELEEDEKQVVVIDESKSTGVRAPKFKTIKVAKGDPTTGDGNIPSDLVSKPTIPLPPPIDTPKNQLASTYLAPLSSPLRPDTPSSASVGGTAGATDRKWNSRRAVKKRRKPVGALAARNSRPTRTQFQVPDESELISDDSGAEEAGAAGADQGDSQQQQQQPRERIVYQFHYHNWASHTCPFIGSLLHFRRRVRICTDQMAKSGKIGPTVVHCNDGCGRTGAYLCIDANLELADEEEVYDVFAYTKKLRQSRKLLIENLDQYKFVYDVLEESLFCGKTWFNVSELHQKLKHKSHRNATTKKNDYQVEYEKICRMTSRFSIGDCAGGHRVENREKNRDVSTVPPDNFRPYLSSFQTNDSTDYINAVFVDGYTRSKEYIVTEWPLHRTMSDFWSLVYDHDCNSVILLANPPESSTYPSFLPTEKELRRKFGPVFSAEMVSYTHYQNIKSWIYTINKKIVSLTEVIAGVKSETKTTQVFQITCWPQAHRVPTSTNALVELMNMVERWRQRTTYGPVCVVSLDGKSRAGVYCAANVAIEQVVQHGEVDVFQAVKTVRRHRPQLIENMTEYKYCYDLILHYVLHYLNQSSSNN